MFPFYAVGARKIDDCFILYVLNAPNLALKRQKLPFFVLNSEKKLAKNYVSLENFLVTPMRGVRRIYNFFFFFTLNAFILS